MVLADFSTMHILDYRDYAISINDQYRLGHNPISVLVVSNQFISQVL